MTNLFNIANFPSFLGRLAGALYGFVEYHNLGYAAKAALIKSIIAFMLLLGENMLITGEKYRK